MRASLVVPFLLSMSVIVRAVPPRLTLDEAGSRAPQLSPAVAIAKLAVAEQPLSSRSRCRRQLGQIRRRPASSGAAQLRHHARHRRAVQSLVPRQLFLARDLPGFVFASAATPATAVPNAIQDGVRGSATILVPTGFAS